MRASLTLNFHTFLVMLLLLCSAGGASAAREEDGAFRVMVYNIAAGNGDLTRIAQVIREQDPDIVSLQEVDVHWSDRSNHRNQVALLSEELGMHSFYAPIYRIPHPDEGKPMREFGVAVLSRYPIKRSANHEISRLSTQAQDPQPELKTGFAEIEAVINGRKIRIFNTHLDYRADPSIRKKQVAEMLEVIGDEEGPTLLMGDLNARPNASELQPLFEKFRDSWPEKEEMPGFTYPSKAPDRRIDYLLLSPDFEVRGVRVLSTDASDHLPIVADLALPHAPDGAPAAEAVPVPPVF